MSAGIESILRLASLFTHAALDRDGWTAALGGLAALTRSPHAELVVVTNAPRAAGSFTLMSAPGSFSQERWLAAGGYSPSANPRIATAIRSAPLEIGHEAHYDAVRPFLTDGDALRDCSAEMGIEYGCQTTLVHDAAGRIGLSVLRSWRDGRTSEADRAAFAAVAPFVRDAARIQIGLEQDGAALIAGTLETMAAAAFLLDAQGRLIRATPAAEALLAAGRLRLAQGRLAGRDAADEAALGRAIGRIASGDDAPVPLATLVLGAVGEAPPLVAEVSALPKREWTFGRLPRVLVLVRAGGLRREGAAATLRAAWGLSAAEADIALRLASGEARDAIAAARRVSAETVRAQIKAIFAKAEVGREAELTARVATLAAAI